MIPRKLAKRLLEEYRQRLHAEIEPVVVDGKTVRLAELSDEVVASSDLVLRGVENMEQKARRYLAEGRLTILRMDKDVGVIVAECRGSDATYSLGFDPRSSEWRCTCPVLGKRRCAHLTALQLVTRRPR